MKTKPTKAWANKHIPTGDFYGIFMTKPDKPNDSAYKTVRVEIREIKRKRK